MKYGASYILPDGKIFKVIDAGCLTHYDYEKKLVKNGKLEKGYGPRRQLINLKQWVRLNDGTNVAREHIVELPIQPITTAQYTALLEFLDYMMYNNKDFVDIGIEEHSHGIEFSDKAIWFKHYEFKEYLPDDIIKEIRQQYEIMRMRGETYGL